MFFKKKTKLNEDEGLTLLEVIVAVVVLGIVGVTILNGISSSNYQAKKATSSEISFNYLTSAAENIASTPFVTCNATKGPPTEYTSALTSSPGTYPVQVARVEALYQSPSDTKNAGIWYDCANWPSGEKASYLQRVSIINTDGNSKSICRQSGTIASSAATTTITGIATTAGFSPGMTILKITNPSDPGAFNGTATIASVDSPTQLTVTTTSTNAAPSNTPGTISFSACSRVVFKNLTGISSSFAVSPLSPRTLFYGRSKSVTLSTVNTPSGGNVLYYILPGSNLPTTCSSTTLAVSLSGSTLNLCVGANYSGSTRLSIDIGAFDLNNSKYATPASLLVDVYPPLDLDTVGPLSNVSGSSVILDSRSRSGAITTSATVSTITGLNSTSGLYAGATLYKASGSGAFGGSGGTATITSVDSPTQITITTSSSNTAGSISFYATSNQYQLVATGGNGLGISFMADTSSDLPGVNITTSGLVTLGVSSTTSNSVGTGTKNFIVSNASLFNVNDVVRAIYVSGSTPPQMSYIQGAVSAVNTSTNQITINATTSSGSTGTFTSWTLVTSPSGSSKSTGVLIRGGGQDVGPPEETTAKTFNIKFNEAMSVNSSDICLSSNSGTCGTTLAACPSTSGAGTCYITVKTASNVGIGSAFAPLFLPLSENTSNPAIATFTAAAWDSTNSRWSIVLKADYSAANGKYCKGKSGNQNLTINNFYDAFTTWSIPFNIVVKC